MAEEPSVSTRLQALSPSAQPAQSEQINTFNHLHTVVPSDNEQLFWRDKIYGILLRHRTAATREPESLLKDVADMADYFSRYGEVRDLFGALDGQPWRWQYGAGQAETQVDGTRLQVRSVQVYFDPRAGAQFQFRNTCSDKIPYCFSAPADLFLHELLHVRAILLDPETFIAQGGMSEYLYPHQHEQQTLALERNLYAAMSRQDHFPRPSRASHTGRRTSTRCVTCLQ